MLGSKIAYNNLVNCIRRCSPEEVKWVKDLMKERHDATCFKADLLLEISECLDAISEEINSEKEYIEKIYKSDSLKQIITKVKNRDADATRGMSLELFSAILAEYTLLQVELMKYEGDRNVSR